MRERAKRAESAVCALVGTLLAGCSAGHRITRFDPSSPVTDADRAAYYALPRTLVQVTFKAKRVEVGERQCHAVLGEPAQGIGGPANATVAEYLGVDPAIQPGTTWAIDGAPETSLLAEPDPDQVFRADLASSPWVRRKIVLKMGPQGVLESGTSLASDRRLELGVAALDVVTSFRIFSSLPLVLTGPTPPSTDPCAPVRAALAAQVRLLLENQRLAAAKLLDARTASWLAERYRARIDRIVGGLSTREVLGASIVCLVQPRRGTRDYDLLEVSKAGGFGALAGRGCSIPAGFAAADGVAMEDTWSLHVERRKDQLVDRFEKAGLGRLPADPDSAQGFYYRIPAEAELRIERRRSGGSSETVLSRDAVVAQLGIVAALPRQSAVETQYDVTLDPMTGALTELTSNAEAVDAKNLGSLADVVGAARKRHDEEAKAAAEATDELALLERQRKLLEERKKIRDLEEELGQDAP